VATLTVTINYGGATEGLLTGLDSWPVSSQEAFDEWNAAYLEWLLSSPHGISEGTVRVFRQKFTLEDAIGSHASSEQACDQWHSSRVFTFLTSSHCKLHPNTEGTVLVLGQKIALATIAGLKPPYV
jgi:hypothetical protein